MWSVSSLFARPWESPSWNPLVLPGRCIRLAHKRARCDNCLEQCSANAIHIGRPGTSVVIDEGCLHCERCVAVCPVDVFQRGTQTEQKWLAALLYGVRDGELNLYCHHLNHGSRKESGLLLRCLGSLHPGAILFFLTHGAGKLELSFGNCNSCPYGGGWEHVANCLHKLQQVIYRNGLDPLNIEEKESRVVCSTPHPVKRGTLHPDRRALLRQLVNFTGRMVEVSMSWGQAENNESLTFEAGQTKHGIYWRALEKYRELSGYMGEIRLYAHTRVIDHGLCNGCGLCVKLCGNSALTVVTEGDTPHFKLSRCCDCGLCQTACRKKAIRCQTLP